MSLAISDREQHNLATAMQYSRDHELEYQVREWAQMCADNPQAYSSGGIVLPYIPTPSLDLSDGRDPRMQVSYHEIRVRLWRGLQGKPKIAALVAEEIIREELAKLGELKERKAYVIRDIEFREQQTDPEPDEPTFLRNYTAYEMRMQINNRILHSRIAEPKSSLVSARDSKGRLAYLERKLRHELLYALGKEIGLIDE